MNDKEIVCRYTFSIEEYKRGLRLFRRTTTSLKEWTPAIFVAIFAVAVIAISNIPSTSTTAPKPIVDVHSDYSWRTLIINFLPVLVFVVLLFIVFKRIRKISFRNSQLFNQNVTYVLSDSDLQFKSDQIESRIQWATFKFASEDEKGFDLVPTAGRSFNWLPKGGFDSPESIGECRELLRRHVADSKKLWSS